MPLQNRVDPWGNLNAVSTRGAWLGNRGVLHNADRQIVSNWKLKAWITCQLHWKGARRKVFSPGRYSELFFLDEATAFAAGHRPCGQCRRGRFNEFTDSWRAANERFVSSDKRSISEIDRVLHDERITRDGRKVTFQAPWSELPDGSMFTHNGVAWLVWRGQQFCWSFEGYAGDGCDLPGDAVVAVLTPKSVVRMFARGFTPEVHRSANENR